MTKTPDDLGQVAYEGARTERLSRRPSDEVVEWASLNDSTRGMWRAAAEAVIDNMPTTTSPVEDAFQASDQVAAYAPFGQPGTLLEDDEGAPFPEETQQLFREVAQDAYLRGDRDGRAVRGRTDQERLTGAGFTAGKTIGAAEREAELLEAGWTPPGGVIIGMAESRDDLIEAGWIPPGSLLGHELEVSSGPTDYEVWRDALTLAVTWCPNGSEDARIQAAAESFWEQLQQVPIRVYDDPEEYECEACGQSFPTAGQRAGHEDEEHAANGD